MDPITQGHSFTFRVLEEKLSQLDRAIEEAEKEIKLTDEKIQALNKKLIDENSSLNEKRQCLLDSKKAHTTKLKNEFSVLLYKFEKENIVSEFEQKMEQNSPIKPMEACAKLICEHEENRRTILTLKETLSSMSNHEDVLKTCKKLKTLVKRQKELEAEMQVHAQYLTFSSSSDTSITTECVDFGELEDLKFQSLPLEIVEKHFDRNRELLVSFKKPSQPCRYRVVTNKMARITGQFFIAAIPCEIAPNLGDPVKLRVTIKYFQGLHPVQVVFQYNNTDGKINVLNL